jgi:hypothetical protein
MPEVKLRALDAEDLAVLSAHLQDAVAKIGDLVYRPTERRFLGVVNRFAWESAAAKGGAHERRRAAFHFDRVSSVMARGLDRGNPDAVVSLLAIRFEPAGADEPGGVIDLVFSGAATVRLTVECIEAQLADLGAAWQAAGKPNHAV